MPPRIVYTKDGVVLRFLVTTGRGREFWDFIGPDGKIFKDPVRGRHLIITGGPFDVGKLYDGMREISSKHFGQLPVAMPPTEVSHLCDFIWEDSKLVISEEEFADIFSADLASYELAPPPPPRVPEKTAVAATPKNKENVATCGHCGRREIGIETFARCSYCGRPFCFGDIENHERSCPSKRK